MLSIGVVGAGVGGLTAALALCDAGFRDVHVYQAGKLVRREILKPEVVPL